MQILLNPSDAYYYTHVNYRVTLAFKSAGGSTPIYSNKVFQLIDLATLPVSLSRTVRLILMAYC